MNDACEYEVRHASYFINKRFWKFDFSKCTNFRIIHHEQKFHCSRFHLRNTLLSLIIHERCNYVSTWKLPSTFKPFVRNIFLYRRMQYQTCILQMNVSETKKKRIRFLNTGFRITRNRNVATRGERKGIISRDWGC